MAVSWRNMRGLVIVALALGCVAVRAQDPALAPDDLTARLRALPASVGENRVVTRRRGESWLDVGVREHVGYEHLRRANPRGFAGRTLFIAGRQQVPALVGNGLVINLPALMNYRLAAGKPVAWYPISIGRIASRWHTPVGSLRIISKRKNPTWNQPDWAGGGKVPPGPKNPLGDRWLGLSRSGYGLHGTDKPSSIGRSVSHGCMRHFPAHIRELFKSAYVGMSVEIIYQPLTVGAQNSVVYLSLFPDIYGRGTNNRAAIRARLAEVQLDGLYDDRALSDLLASQDGVARPILGSATPVTLNGAALALPIGPTARHKRLYLPAKAVAERLGATVTYVAETRTLTIARGARQAAFVIDGEQAFQALGAAFVPARALLEGLGGTVDVNGKAVALYLRE